MITKLLRAKTAIDIALFTGTTVALSVLSHANLWTTFAIVAAICVILYATLKVGETSQATRLIENWRAREREMLSTLQKCGVFKIYNMQDQDELVERNRSCREIIDRGTEFSLSGSTGASYVSPTAHRHWDNLRRRLDNGDSFRLLLTSPFCPSKAIRNRLNGVSTVIDPKLDLANIDRLRTRYSRFEVRFTDEVYCSVFFTEHDMIYDPYHCGQVNDRLENRFMAIQLIDRSPENGSSYFRQLKNHFNFLWKEGTSWEDFIEAHHDQLKHYLTKP